MTLEALARETADMAPHLATLCRLARDANSIVEFGVRTGVSTWALLDGLPPDGRLTSVDIEDVRPDLPDRITNDERWAFIHGDDLVVTLPRADLVLIDTTHEYHHTLEELRLAADIGARRIVLHDWNLPDVQDATGRFMRDSGYWLQALEPSEWGLAVLAR